ncbi:amidase signature domain-containing protein [Chaetomidium leptoderma]|uniref:Amidase signature domain-containing protein n=1 Tax=Chaetomidium leptoderma TaxID=669021 RepID=A0AAN6ZSM3_9PEZI|nr:amidase signature domain-containing protein [Chaetomidium leptoderma]
MPSFGNLPLEIALEIVKALCPHCTPKSRLPWYEAPVYGETYKYGCDCGNAHGETFISALAHLCLTSKLLNTLATPHLYHRPWCVRWPMLARTLLARPDLARHVKHLIGYSWETDDLPLDDSQCPMEVVDYYYDVLDPRWDNTAGESERGVPVHILTSLCPNLAALEVFKDFLDRSEPASFLKQVRNVQLRHSNPDDGMDLSYLRQMAREATHLTRLVCHSMNLDTLQSWQEPISLPTFSRLTHLRIKHSAVAPEYLPVLFAACPRLQSFSYSYGRGTGGFGQFTPLEAQKALVSYAPNLGSLHLDPGFHVDCGYNSDRTRMRSLADLSRLEHLALTLGCFLPGPPRRGSDEPDGSDPMLLIHLLPTSIRSFRILPDISRPHLFGLPIIRTILDSINTDPSLGMPTTLGSYAFEKSRPKSNSVVVQTLLDKGLIILGKASLTELGNFKGDNITSGWSALNGQTQSAYVQGGVKHREMRLGHTVPGLRVALLRARPSEFLQVTAPYLSEPKQTALSAPLQSRAALYDMKPTVGSTPMDGIFVISTTFDTVGAMAKSVDDLATLRDWSGLRLGFVDPDKWWLPPGLVTPVEEVKTQIKASYEAAMKKIQSSGGEVIYPVELVHPKQNGIGKAMDTIFDYEPRGVVAKYLETRDDPNMKSLEDIANFNIEHADLELPEDYPNQNAILDALNHKFTRTDYEAAKATLQKEALENGVRRIMEEGRLDAIIGPTDGPLASISAAIGGPIATMPVGLLNLHGRPFGLSVITLPKHDGVLFKVMSAWEATFPKRALPPLLLKQDTNL